MTMPSITISPRQTFKDNMRPALLLLDVYRLLDSNDKIHTEGEMVDSLRKLTHASADEDVMLIYHELFLGLVRERALLPRSTLRQSTLNHLLRQCIVASCTALETFLPALLGKHLPILIRVRGRNFVPRDDHTVSSYFEDLHFSLDDTLRLLSDDDAPQYIANKILGLANFKYLSSRKGVHVVAALLGISSPWNEIATHLDRDKKEIMKILDDTVARRNDIVHRADRPQTDPAAEMQDIGYAWTQQAADTINHICLALDELVQAQVSEMNSATEA